MGTGRRSILAVIIIAVLAAVGSLGAVLAPRPAPAPETIPEHLAPDFQVALYQGYESDGARTVNISDYRGRPLVVNFWAEWCPPCVIEMPHLEAVQRRFEDHGLVVLGADVGPYGDGHDATAVAFLARVGVSFPAGRISLDGVDDRYHLDSVPTTVFINRDGSIHGIWSGFIEEEPLLELVEAIVAE